MNGTINEQAVLDRYEHYRSSMNTQEAVDCMIQDCINENLSDEEILFVISEMLVPSIATRFAESWESSRKKYEPGDYFNAFCKFGHIGKDLENAVAKFINEGAQRNAADNADCVFRDNDWNGLSDEERQQKVKLFLKKLANASRDFSDNKVFTAVTKVGPDDSGNDFSAGINQFNRGANHYGHLDDEGQDDDESQRLKPANVPTVSEGLEDADKNLANVHPLAMVLKKHGYGYSKTVRATSINHPKVTVTPHHIFVNHANHLVGVVEGDTKWVSKVSPHSGHSWEGIGSHALDKHLENKSRRYKKQLEQQSLPNILILENLLRPSSTVQRYSEYMKRNPFRSLDHDVPSNDARDQRDSLKEAWALREQQERVYGTRNGELDSDTRSRMTSERNKK